MCPPSYSVTVFYSDSKGKCRLGEGKHFDERRPRPLFTLRAPPSSSATSSPRAGALSVPWPAAPQRRRTPPRSARRLPDSPSHLFRFKLFTPPVEVEGRGRGEIKKKR